MSSTVSESLLTAGVQTLETFAFMMVDPLTEDQEENFSMGVSIEFKGKFNGILQVWAEESFLQSVYETLVGDAEPNVQLGMENSLKEIANIVAGNFLTENFGVHEEFDLSLPALTEFEGLYDERIWISDMETEGKLLLQVKLAEVS